MGFGPRSPGLSRGAGPGPIGLAARVWVSPELGHAAGTTAVFFAVVTRLVC